MRAPFVLCVCVVSVCVSGCAALEVETRALGHCKEGQHLAQERALDNVTLHQQIYDWANQRDTETWEYVREGRASAELLALFDVSGSDAAALECATVNYSASIRLPGIFSSLLSVFGVDEDIKLQVKKVICHTNDVIYEEADIDAPVVGKVEMKARHTLYNGKDVVSLSHTKLDLPWYAFAFAHQTSAALDHSVLEKFGAIIKSLCVAEDGGGALLRRKLTPKQNRSFAEEPERRKVRKFPLVRTDSRGPETLVLGRVGLRRTASAPEMWA